MKSSIFSSQNNNKVIVSTSLEHKVNKTLVALETLANVKAFSNYVRTTIPTPTKNEKILANIVMESICTNSGVSVSSLSFEDMNQTESDISSLGKDLNNNLIESMSDLIPSIYSDITNFSLESNKLISSLNKIENELKQIPNDKPNLIENIQPEDNYIYLFTTKGLDLNSAVNTPTTFYDAFNSNFDAMVLRAIEWAYNESRIKMSRISKPFNSYVANSDFKYTDLPGLLNLNLVISSIDSTPSVSISLDEEVDSSNIVSELITQSQLTPEQWLEFNKVGRRESDKTVLPAMSLSDISILINKLKVLHANVIQTRVNTNEQLFINKNEEGVIPFTYVLKSLINNDDLSTKSYEILRVLLNVLLIRSSVDKVLTKYIFDIINTLNSLLNRNINFYKY